MGDIKEINSGNFKSKQFDGKITFQNPKEETKTIWYLSKGKIVKKGKSSTKKNKPSKTSRYVSVYSCHTYEVCVGPGGEEVCNDHTTCNWEEVWEEDDPNVPPPDNPYDCAINPSWPWCQDNGGGGDPTTDPSIGDTSITVDSPDIPITDIIEQLECFDRNQGAKITIYSNQPIANSTYLFSITDRVGHSFITIDQGQNIETIGFYPAGLLPGAFGPVWGIMGDNSNNEYDVSITINVNAQTLSGILDESIIWGSTTPYDLHNKNCTDFAITIGNLSGLNIPDCYGSFYNGTGGSTPGRFGEYLREMQLPSGTTRNTTTSNSPTNKRNCF